MSSRQHGHPAVLGRSYMEIEAVAADIRQQLVPGLSAEATLPGLTVFESLNQNPLSSQGKKVRLDYAVNELPVDIEALTIYDRAKRRIVLALSTKTYENLEREEPRSRFSLFHEVGHAVLHHEELRTLSRQPSALAIALMRKSVPSHPTYMDTEWQADAFSAATLMPAKGLYRLEITHGGLNPSIIVATFNVSYQAAETRLAVYSKNRADLICA